MSLPQVAQLALRDVVRALVRGEFDLLARDGRSGRLTAAELKRAIAAYGRTLVELPQDALDEADVIPLTGVSGAYAVDVPLWTDEEGRSDLTLSTTVACTTDGARVEIDDLHVL